MRRNVVLLVVIALILVTALWWLFLISPRRAEIDDLRTQRETAVAEEQRLRGEKARLLEIQDNELTFMTAGAALERLIPPNPELATFIDDVTVLALDSEVDLLSLSPGLPAADAFAEFASMSVFINVEGQFFEVLGFLYGLADMERLVRVDGVSLSPAIQEDGTVIISAGLTTTIFTTAIPVVQPDVPTTTTTAPGATTTTTSAATTTTTPAETTTSTTTTAPGAGS